MMMEYLSYTKNINALAAFHADAVSGYMLELTDDNDIEVFYHYSSLRFGTEEPVVAYHTPLISMDLVQHLNMEEIRRKTIDNDYHRFDVARKYADSLLWLLRHSSEVVENSGGWVELDAVFTKYEGVDMLILMMAIH